MNDSPAWSNAVLAMPSCGFLDDLGSATANDGSADGGARYLLSRVSDFLRSRGQLDGPNQAFDFAIWDVEAIAALWPAFRLSSAQHSAPPETLPTLARFIVDRLPAIWARPWAGWLAPVSRAVALADRIDTLVGMFAIGLAPNGSKDPYALRRAANEIIADTLFPARIGQ